MVDPRDGIKGVGLSGSVYVATSQLISTMDMGLTGEVT